MINIPLIGIATALVIGAMIAKLFADQPKKASKSQKSEIIKQLLALSEHDNRIAATPSAVRLPAPLSNQATRPGNASRKTATKISPPIRSSK